MQSSGHGRRYLHSSSLAKLLFNEKTKDLSEVQAAEVVGSQHAEAELVDAELTASWHHNNKSPASCVTILCHMVVLFLQLILPCSNLRFS